MGSGDSAHLAAVISNLLYPPLNPKEEFHMCSWMCAPKHTSKPALSGVVCPCGTFKRLFLTIGKRNVGKHVCVLSCRVFLIIDLWLSTVSLLKARD